MKRNAKLSVKKKGLLEEMMVLRFNQAGEEK